MDVLLRLADVSREAKLEFGPGALRRREKAIWADAGAGGGAGIEPACRRPA